METILIGAVLLLAGVVMLVIGFSRRSSAGAMRDIPCRYINALVPGERQFISGKARSPVHMQAPVSKQDCVFYHEQIEELRYRGGHHRGVGNHSWERVADNFYGAFYVDDPTGAALVLPGFDSLDLGKPELRIDESLQRRRSERAILQGETVSALGRPRKIGELIQYLRQSPGAKLSSELLAELMRLETDPAAAALPCFFGQGLEKLADQPCADYVAGTGESASSMLQIGGVLAAVGAGLVVYSLKAVMGAAPNIE
jgi:hypothetical protein